MTVSSLKARTTYLSDGVSVSFATAFKFLDDAHVRVTIDTAGVETVQTQTVDYTISGAGNFGGGTVNFLVAPPAGRTVIIQRVLAYEQPTALGADLPVETLETMIDRAVMLIQQLNDAVSRGLVLAPSSTTSPPTLPALVASGLLQVSAAGTALQWSLIDDLVATAPALLPLPVPLDLGGTGVTTLPELKALIGSDQLSVWRDCQ